MTARIDWLLLSRPLSIDLDPLVPDALHFVKVVDVLSMTS